MGRHSSDADRGGNEWTRAASNGGPASGASRSDDDFGFEHREAGSGRRGGWLWAIIALIAVVALVTGVIIWQAGSGGCGDRTRVAVASDAAMTGPLREVARQASADSCYDYDVQTAAGADVPGLLTQGAAAPDLWVADSQVQARRVTTQVRRDLDLVAPSIASTPTVVAGENVPGLDTWVEVMKLPDLRTGSPVDTSTGDAPIIGALAAVDAGELPEEKFTEAMTVLAIQQNNARLTNDNEGTRLNLANTAGVPVVTTEQQYELFMRTHQGSKLKSSIPAAGTVMLDYPLVNTASAARQQVADEAGAALVAALNSDAGRKALTDAGYRDADGNGVGEPLKKLELRDPTSVDKALRQWQVLGVPIRSLVVQDTSGSMATPAGGTTRAGLLIDASTTGLKLFPNNTMIGGWAFSVDKGGDGQDWVEMAPIRRLDARSGSGTHREALGRAVEEGLSDLGGGTGLYDTTLAAFKKVQDTYDPNYSNSVIIMTDGQNEDPNSISLDELLAELKRLEDPARPVLVLTIGISDDADSDALKQIAEATGGTTYIAENAADIRTVFVDAIQARVAAAGR
ncbi:substrate-binding domain-containing protein [Gordonia rubripertincta]|uniref:Substrate-binding domain-containing protein n=1 Tax=Gordonia rubripertincta TaxID=36822 RepID=A0AAW4G9R3_GORRU|nr:substrate-binding domain-containing protein [Gordonia rubripertincta]MBM7280297.1 substrate-binding domain-containing protein [Gordonia rubripertincta]QMU20758.1 substrate-binding domain-containing protein [Gordonia rubripertincta]